MSLFLPSEFVFIPDFLTDQDATALHAGLDANIAWQRPSVRLFGKTMPVPRRVAWFGTHAYGYSGIVHDAAPMPRALAALCQRLQTTTGQPYNGVLLNRYQDGQDSMGWHSDDDYDAGEHSGVASISLGSARRFRLRRRDQKTSLGIELTHGSLLYMKPGTQSLWQHAIPRTQKTCGVRINLTFRYMVRSNSL